MASAASSIALSSVGLVDDTEPLFVEAAYQMTITGDYVTPQFNAMPRFDKPPLAYWAMATAIQIATQLPSSNHPALLVAAARMPSILMGMFTCAAVGRAAQKYNAANSAVVVAAAVAGAPFFAIWYGAALSDASFVSTAAFGILALFAADRETTNEKSKHTSYRRWAVTGAILGAATLTKGPVGAALPVVVLCTYHALRFAAERRIHALSSQELMEKARRVAHRAAVVILAACAVALPWYALMVWRHGAEYIGTFFGYHHIERALIGVNHHGGRPAWFPAACTLLGAGPLGILGVPVVVNVLRMCAQAPPRRLTDANAFRLLLTSWALASFACFSVSASQLPSYYLPCVPALAGLGGIALANHREMERGVGTAAFAAAALLTLLAVAWSAAPSQLASLVNDAETARIGMQLSASGVGVLGAVSYAAAAASCIWLARGGRIVAAASALFASLACFWATAFPAALRSVDAVRQAPLRAASAHAHRYVSAHDGAPVCCVGRHLPSVVFYARAPVAFFHTTGAVNEALRWNGDIRRAVVVAHASDCFRGSSWKRLQVYGVDGTAGDGTTGYAVWEYRKPMFPSVPQRKYSP